VKIEILSRIYGRSLSLHSAEQKEARQEIYWRLSHGIIDHLIWAFNSFKKLTILFYFQFVL
jgi:hypothetical protein